MAGRHSRHGGSTGSRWREHRLPPTALFAGAALPGRLHPPRAPGVAVLGRRRDEIRRHRRHADRRGDHSSVHRRDARRARAEVRRGVGRSLGAIRGRRRRAVERGTPARRRVRRRTRARGVLGRRVRCRRHRASASGAVLDARIVERVLRAAPRRSVSPRHPGGAERPRSDTAHRAQRRFTEVPEHSVLPVCRLDPRSLDGGTHARVRVGTAGAPASPQPLARTGRPRREVLATAAAGCARVCRRPRPVPTESGRGKFVGRRAHAEDVEGCDRPLEALEGELPGRLRIDRALDLGVQALRDQDLAARRLVGEP
jgi:hypothetical protein